MIEPTKLGGQRYNISLPHDRILDYSDAANEIFYEVAEKALQHVADKVEIQMIKDEYVLIPEPETQSILEHNLNFYTRDIYLEQKDIEEINMHLEGLVNFPSCVQRMVEQLSNLIVRDISEHIDFGKNKIKIYFGPADTIEYCGTLGKPVYCFVKHDSIETESRYFIEVLKEEAQDYD